jgi:Ca2+-binding RTX toxin-like protein
MVHSTNLDFYANGSSGNDIIISADGNDTIFGYQGHDTLTGGAGSDVFEIAFGGDTAEITDFVHGVDKFELLNTPVYGFFSSLPDGALSASIFKVLGSGVDSDDRILYDQVTGQLYFDADGNGATAKVLFAQVTPGMVLSADDFQVI